MGAVCLRVLLLAATSAAFSLGGGTPSPHAARPSVQSRSVSLAMGEGDSNWLKDAWAKYVLIRPEMGMDDLRNSTTLRTAKEWEWETRTPGTLRTIVISTFVVCLFAIPALLANPLILPKLLEAAVLSREGYSPLEVIKETGNIFGE